VDREHGPLMFGVCRSAPLVAKDGDFGEAPTARMKHSVPTENSVPQTLPDYLHPAMADAPATPLDITSPASARPPHIAFSA
jgi:hypothetical protein